MRGGEGRQFSNFVEKKTLMFCKELGEEICQGTVVESVDERQILGAVQEEALEVTKLRSQGGSRLTERIWKRRGLAGKSFTMVTRSPGYAGGVNHADEEQGFKTEGDCK